MSPEFANRSSVQLQQPLCVTDADPQIPVLAIVSPAVNDHRMLRALPWKEDANFRALGFKRIGRRTNHDESGRRTSNR